VEQVTKAQIKSIYALGASLSMVERDNHDDALHQLVEGLTAKNSVTTLSFDEAEQVITELMSRMRGSHVPPAPPISKPKKYDETPGGVTTGQQRRAWQLMYELKKFDRQPVAATLGDRLCGIIKRQFGVDASAKNPFRFLNYHQGVQLIEMLKKYCANAETRHMRGESG
jgi:hypothetical protein